MRGGAEGVRADGECVALDVDENDALVARDALRDLGVTCLGVEGAERAAVVVVRANGDAVTRIAEIRARGRIDVGVIVVRPPEIDPRALHRAGALASITSPIDASALATIVEHAVADVDPPHESITVNASSATLARLGGALAHEIGTPLAALSMNLDVVAHDLERLRASDDLLRALLEGSATMDDVKAHVDAAEPDDPIDALHDARSSVDRLGALLQRIKAIADRAQKQVVSFALGNVVRDAARVAAGGDVSLEERIAPNVAALGHAPTVEAIVGALVRNASEAARELTSPRVRVEVESNDEDVVVRVIDNGPGIDVEVQQKIFEPFYTTRRGLGGVGLGLTVARDQARALGGDVIVDSRPGRGAAFRLQLRRGDV